MNLKKIIFLAGFIFLSSAGYVFLAPAVASAVPCPTATLAVYIGFGAGGCTVTDKLFFDFAYLSSAVGATPIPATGITVTPIVLPGDPGLLFSAGWVAGPGVTLDSLIFYTVETGGALIKDNSLGIAGVATTGTGIVTVAENKCLGGLFSPSPFGTLCTPPGTPMVTLFVFDTPGFFDVFDTIVFSPVAFIDVIKDITVSGGFEGIASLSAVSQQFSQVVPEPSTFVLFGSALLGLAGMRRLRVRLLMS